MKTLCAVLIISGLAATVPGPTPALAGEPKQKAVLELFTSQGCSSCPPADRLLKKYVERDDVIALSLPVDYWDYLGWKDTMASPENSRRQRVYAGTRGDGQVYTPQVVINGLMHVNGADASAINAGINTSNAKLANYHVPMKIRTAKNSLIIEVDEAPRGLQTKKTGTIWLARVKRSTVVKIRRGENGGQDLSYHNVANKLTAVGQWSGEAVKLKLPKNHMMSDGSDGCIVFLQLGRGGPIIGAAELKKW